MLQCSCFSRGPFILAIISIYSLLISFPLARTQKRNFSVSPWRFSFLQGFSYMIPLFLKTVSASTATSHTVPGPSTFFPRTLQSPSSDLPLEMGSKGQKTKRDLNLKSWIEDRGEASSPHFRVPGLELGKVTCPGTFCLWANLAPEGSQQLSSWRQRIW